MGLNISIQTKDYEDHPDWDWCRHAGDRELAKDINNLDLDTLPCALEMNMVRPKDFEAFRALVRDISDRRGNQKRFRLMADILQNEPDYWLYFGY